MNEAIYNEVVKLNPSSIVELYELDLTMLGEDTILYFHNGTNGIRETVSFLAQEYTPLPIMVKGFEMASSGEPARPTLSIMNIGGFMSALILGYNDIVGAKLTRRRTFAKYLDGEPSAANVQYPPDIFVVEQKTKENRMMVEFELGTGLDLDGFRYPVRQVVSGYCPFDYRGAGCAFAEDRVVSNNSGSLFDGAATFRGVHNAATNYNADDTVSYTGASYFGVFRATVDSPTEVPEEGSEWERIQRFRGEYNSATADYAKNDVVYFDSSDGYRIYAIAIYPELGYVPAGLRPPNKVYWATDRCGKFLQQCMVRFDPEQTGNALPYGGFPGTLNLPEV